MPTAAKPSSAKPKGARKTAAKRRTSTRSKAARTRATNHRAEYASRDAASVFGDYAERAVLIPVGAALTARDRVLESVGETIAIYSSPTKTQAQLRRYERRGATARNRLERQVRKTRVRFERQLRQRRRKFERTVNDLEDRRDTVAKNGGEFANRVQERIANLV
jgi:hypothetical protein